VAKHASTADTAMSNTLCMEVSLVESSKLQR
jgi:hypothetical protein